MAARHTNKGIVISIDLKDFFKSIKQHHLLNLFKQYGIGDKPARTLSEICTFGSFLPQGALTSPKLSNLITATTFGPPLKAWCDSKGLTLTIYADDITISSTLDMVTGNGYGEAYKIINKVSSLVSPFGFSINKKKTKIMRSFQRQYICGAVVNTKVNLQKTERRTLRAMVHNVVKNGLVAEASKTGDSPEHFFNVLMGRLNWFSQLNPCVGARHYISSLKQILSLESQVGAEDGSKRRA
jgi:RNA-directed DNA polymerase